MPKEKPAKFEMMTPDQLANYYNKIKKMREDVGKLVSLLRTIARYQDVLKPGTLAVVYQKMENTEDVVLTIDAMERLIEPIKAMNDRWETEFKDEGRLEYEIEAFQEEYSKHLALFTECVKENLDNAEMTLQELPSYKELTDSLVYCTDSNSKGLRTRTITAEFVYRDKIRVLQREIESLPAPLTDIDLQINKTYGNKKEKSSRSSASGLLLAAHADMEKSYAEMHYHSLQMLLNDPNIPVAPDPEATSIMKNKFRDAFIFLDKKRKAYEEKRVAYEYLLQHEKEAHLKSYEQPLTDEKKAIIKNELISNVKHLLDYLDKIVNTSSVDPILVKKIEDFKKTNAAIVLVASFISVKRPGLRDLVSGKQGLEEFIIKIEADNRASLRPIEKEIQTKINAIEDMVLEDLFLEDKHKFQKKVEQIKQKFAGIPHKDGTNFKQRQKELRKIELEVTEMHDTISIRKKQITESQSAIAEHLDQMMNSKACMELSTALVNALPNNILASEKDKLSGKFINFILNDPPDLTTLKEKLQKIRSEDKPSDIKETLRRVVAGIHQKEKKIEKFQELLKNDNFIAFIKEVGTNAPKDDTAKNILYSEDMRGNIADLLDITFELYPEALIDALFRIDFNEGSDSFVISEIARFMEKKEEQNTNRYFLIDENKKNHIRSELYIQEVIPKGVEGDNRDQWLKGLRNKDALWAFKVIYDIMHVESTKAFNYAQNKEHRELLVKIYNFCATKAFKELNLDELDAVLTNPTKYEAANLIFSSLMKDVLSTHEPPEHEDWGVWADKVVLKLLTRIATDENFATALVKNCNANAPNDNKQILQLFLSLNTENNEENDREVKDFLQQTLITKTIADPEKKDQNNENYKKIIISYCSAAQILKEDEDSDYQKELFGRMKPILSVKPEEIALLASSLQRLQLHFNDTISKEKDPAQVVLLQKTQLKIFDILISKETWPVKIKSSSDLIEQTFPDNRPFYIKIYDAISEFFGKPHQVKAPAANQVITPEERKEAEIYKNIELFKLFKTDLKTIAKEQPSTKQTENNAPRVFI